MRYFGKHKNKTVWTAFLPSRILGYMIDQSSFFSFGSEDTIQISVHARKENIRVEIPSLTSFLISFIFIFFTEKLVPDLDYDKIYW